MVHSAASEWGMPMRDRLFRDNTEPTIDELLSDPIAQLLRKRDGIEIGDVRAAVEQAKTALRQRCLARSCLTGAAA
ncbi:MAG: hypothetical protein KGL11_12080 [Alphaproteobacteria bacterium]|nr:hypothetical protein [Alphaproteobacteria bacterium]